MIRFSLTESIKLALGVGNDQAAIEAAQWLEELNLAVQKGNIVDPPLPYQLRSEPDLPIVTYAPDSGRLTITKVELATRELELTPAENNIYGLLTKQPGKLLSAAELGKSEQAVQSAMSRLRGKLEPPVQIESHRGLGYSFIPGSVNLDIESVIRIKK